MSPIMFEDGFEAAERRGGGSWPKPDPSAPRFSWTCSHGRTFKLFCDEGLDFEFFITLRCPDGCLYTNTVPVLGPRTDPELDET